MATSSGRGRSPFQLAWTLVGIVLVAAIGALDFWTGPDWGFSLIYLVPIIAASWWLGVGAGLVLAIWSAAGWFLAEVAWQRDLTLTASVWNGLTRLAIFTGAALALARLRTTQNRLKYLLGVEERLARTDHLTGLANTRSFLEQSDPSRRRDDLGPLALLYVDIDGFKHLNDAYGHAEGDALLQEVARAIQASVRASDIAARVGGDEFAIVTAQTDAGTATAIAERLLDSVRAIAARYRLAPVGVSIGIAEREDSSQTIGDLLRRADDAMYRAKASGKGRIVRWVASDSPVERSEALETRDPPAGA
jgi:diguanylate cyclase (GGDEF)-like protein